MSSLTTTNDWSSWAIRLLGFITSDYLYRHYPDMNEGALTRLRSFLVRRSTLARLAGQLNLGAHLWLGRGEEESGGRERDATLCAVFEALVGAIFLDQGMDITTNFVLEQLEPEIVRLKGYSTSKDSKSRLQEFVQGNFNTTPRYKTQKSSGPDHARFFTQTGDGFSESHWALERDIANRTPNRLLRPWRSIVWASFHRPTNRMRSLKHVSIWRRLTLSGHHRPIPDARTR